MTIVIPAAIVVVVAAAAWIVSHINEVMTLFGLIWSGLARIFSFADRKAVKLRVEGRINSAVDDLLQIAPSDIVEGRLKIKWINAARDPYSVIGDGEVVVCMRKAVHQEENLCNALMAYLPNAVVPRARRYVSTATMKGVDLVLGKSLIVSSKLSGGFLQMFYDQHLQPARTSDGVVRNKIERSDAIDINGWLTRLFLHEVRALGDRLFPGEPHPRYLMEVERFHAWLYALAIRGAGEKSPLAFEGELLKVGVILVAKRRKWEEMGARPYMWWFGRYMNTLKVDTVYLIGSDETVEAVEELRDMLKDRPGVGGIESHIYAYGRQFRARVAQRERAIVVAVHRDSVTAFLDDEDVERELAAEGWMDRVEEIGVTSGSDVYEEVPELAALEVGSRELEELAESAIEGELVAEGLRGATDDVEADVLGEVDPGERGEAGAIDDSVPSQEEVAAYVVTWVRDRERQERTPFVASLGLELLQRFPGAQPVHERIGFDALAQLLARIELIEVSGSPHKLVVHTRRAVEDEEVPRMVDVVAFVVAWIERMEKQEREPLLSTLGHHMRRRFPGRTPVHQRLGFITLRALADNLDGVTVEGARDRPYLRRA